MINQKYIQQLPAMPQPEELAQSKRKSMRKKRPVINNGDHGGHEDLGFFTVHIDEEPFIEWSLKGGDTKKFSYLELSENQNLEFERLEVGWLIGNIYSLNKMIHIQGMGGPAGESWLKEYARVSNWYEKNEKNWYEWAVAKASSPTN